MTSSQPHGRTIRDSSGYAAFLPAPLPPLIAWDRALVADLSAADRAIGRLAGEGRRLRNPHLFIKPFVHREAVLSSRIEGTRTTLGELLVAAAGGTFGRAPADLEEVANYVAALEHGLERLSSLPLSLRLIRELHERLMRGVRGDTALPGEFRHSQNWIGPPGCSLSEAMYVPPPPAELMACLDPFERFLHDDSLPPLVHAGLAHAQFEAIHPFLDGNGRIGRLLITLQPLQSLAQERGVGSTYGRHRRGLRRRHTDDRQFQRSGSPARSGLKKGGPDRCMGRSRGGLTTKIHTVVDASGLPLRFALSPGQAHDSTLAGALLDDHLPPDSFVLADKAYDAEWIRAMIEAQDAVPIIPNRSSTTTPHAFSRVLYRMRNRVERFFNKLKQFRRIATRYEKLAANYLAMIKIATIRIWLRVNESTA